MKKYIFTESQIKRIIDNQLDEQMSAEQRFAKNQQSSFDAVYNNPTIKEQLAKKKYPAGTKFGFSPAMVEKLSNPKSNYYSHSNILYVVQKGDSVDKIVRDRGANSKENVMACNDLLKNNPMNLEAGMVITFSLLPSGN